MNKDRRSLMIGIVLLLFTLIYIMMGSYKAAVLSGVLSVIWFGKAFSEWKKNRK